MRVFGDCYELMSECFREVYEMGHIVHPNSMQNKIVKDDDNYITKEIISFSYCLTSFETIPVLFIANRKVREWADAEFEERISLEPINPGEAWKLRKDVWEQFLNDKGKFDYTYNLRLDPAVKLSRVINEIKDNPDSRQLVLNIWDSSDILYIGGERRVPCSIYYQVLVRNNRLNLVYNQRSADIVTHFGNDVYLAIKLLNYIAERTDYEPGYLFHNIGSFHAYKKDWNILRTSISDLRNARV